MRVRVLVPLFVAVALLATGCAGGEAASARTLAPNPSAPGSNPAATSTPPAAGPVPATLKFTGTTLDGQPFDAASLAGRPVILWFWAPWCATCFGQGSTVAEVAKRYAGRVSIVGVAGLDKSTKAMKDFVTEAEVGTITHLDDRAGALWKRFGIKEQSAFVMISRSGEVKQTGYQDSVTLVDWAAYLDQH